MPKKSKHRFQSVLFAALNNYNKIDKLNLCNMYNSGAENTVNMHNNTH